MPRVGVPLKIGSASGGGIGRSLVGYWSTKAWCDIRNIERGQPEVDRVRIISLAGYRLQKDLGRKMEAQQWE